MVIFNHILLLASRWTVHWSYKPSVEIFFRQTKRYRTEQAGFKKDHSTLDHIFVLKTVIDIYLSNKKRLYACFVDYEKAFDKVDRLQLWIKLLNSNISDKIFNVLHNLYAKAKSRVFVNGELWSNTFPCQVGVRQGDSLSPLLSAIYLSDLNKFLSEHCEGLKLVPALASEFIFDDKLLYYLNFIY